MNKNTYICTVLKNTRTILCLVQIIYENNLADLEKCNEL